ncbi:hypothetical protein MYCTH_2299998 [Thermothelomyces thermophilus ATCC 42464]|uniref:Uncharacterized protein n=1 Tax=Thermothelomyces thermophilus (strain ATCC 42464 / BCRC 31852 / DSM 1799) TaxID=573729 RepID=G2QA56_THET4|nr:uncharacterized protein MYCTH_2299998 [Thermothelomyces thermophilus ATCC 42464]AEO55804.1 hypothetical protein MYCTH_2299998 [Thermothelomyces thermophilus ATCC 42464]
MTPLSDDVPRISRGAEANADKRAHGDGDVGPPRAHESQDPWLQQARNAGYTTHIRSASRTTWDGRAPLPRSRSPSPPHAPAQSRLSNPPRPSSAISLPNHHAAEHGRPTVLADRWSYDRERMPPPPPAPRDSRPGTPGTPASDPDASDTGFSRPASTLIESQTPSRQQSGFFNFMNGSAEPNDSPPLPSDFDQRGQHLSPHLRQSCHILTDEEMEMLARPPPPHPPMTAPSRPSSPGRDRGACGSAAPGHSSESTSAVAPPEPPQPREGVGRHLNRNSVNSHGSDHSRDVRPSCLGMCDIAPVRPVLGKFGAWFMGVVTPVSFGLLTGCLASTISGCR